MERLSIVIPSYNQAQYLPITLDSVFTQQPPAFQVIVVDGGSTDGTLEILELSLIHISEPTRPY